MDINKFFSNTDQLWSIEESKLAPLKRFLLRTVKRIIVTIDCTIKNNLLSHASALTYSSLLSVVPILAIVFSISRGFGFESFLEERLKEEMQTNPEMRDIIFDWVNSYIAHTQEGIFFGVGLAILLYTLIILTSNVETAFNAIWLVKSSRNIYRRVTDYVSVILILPFVIVITSGLNLFIMTFRETFLDEPFISEALEWCFKLGPLVLTTIAFTLLFKLMPNTYVKWRSTLFPAFLTSVLFLLVQYVYLHYQIQLSSYNAIYGSFAAIPMFILWLHITWCICLIGGQLCYANQNLDRYAFERQSRDFSRRTKDAITLLLIYRIIKRFELGKEPYTERTLAEETSLPKTVVRTQLDILVNSGLLAETHNAKGTVTYYLPTIDIHRYTLHYVLQEIDKNGAENFSKNWNSINKEWNELFRIRSCNENVQLVKLTF